MARSNAFPASATLRPEQLNRLLQLLRRSERDLFAGGDLDALPRCWVTTHPRRAVPHLQGVDAAHPDFVALG
jgi:hypothetical protein